MSPISKFAVFLALAGILAVLFAFVPGNRQKTIPSENVELHPANPSVPSELLRQDLPTGQNKTGEANYGASAEGKIFSPQVKVPAIRGMKNYGWVQLPRGTRVDLVREVRDGLWVRWDGTTVKVPQGAASAGAVLVR
jgi:hypothetical protein